MKNKCSVRIVCFICCAFLGLIAAELKATELENVDATKHETPVICYVGSWARYRTGDGFFDASAFNNPKLCSHLIYAFVGLNETTHEVKILDPPAELGADEGGKDGFQSYINLKQKNPRLKVIVAIGGWNEGSEKYSAMASTEATRRTFIESVVKFMMKYKFDGFDIDWEYPTQRGGKTEDKDNFSSLLKEMRTVFNEYGWLLSVAIGAGPHMIDQAYDIPIITKNVDFINLMTYDFHGKWDNKTGHNTPLYEGENGLDAFMNINSSIHHLLKLGSMRNKLVLGLAFYGRTFTLDDAKNPTVGSPAHDLGPQGPFTQEANLMAYSEVCREISSKSWIRSRDTAQRVPYASKEKAWISYDDAKSIQEKVAYAVDHKLAGVMIWSIEMDDLLGGCHGVPMYLLKTINKALITDDDRENVITDERTEKPKDDKNKESDGNAIRPTSITFWAVVMWWLACYVVRGSNEN